MRLRTILFLMFCGVGLLPVGTLAVWEFRRAHEREIRIVDDTHLLLARNLGAALDRYARDVRSTFEMTARLALAGEPTSHVHELLRDLDFVHLCIADATTGRIVGGVIAERFPCPEQVPADRFDLFVELARTDSVQFSPVMARPNGAPTLYILRRYGSRLAIAAVDTRYIVSRGKAIAFGKKGHAAIVDHTGRLMAHPLDDWIAERRDISRLEPVRRMLAGQTGTIIFFSPALKADMVAGYTHVQATGWGVMIPQPLAEIKADADAAAMSALGIAIAGVAGAAALAWVLSGLLTRPIRRVSAAAERMAAGDLEARVGEDRDYKPAEIRELATSFDAMVETVARSSAELNAALRQARDAGEAKTNFLSTISHEIRTPMNGVLGSSEFLLDTELTADQRKIASTIHDSARALLDIVNDVLDMSKIEAGKFTLTSAPVAPRDLLNGLIAELMPLAAAKGLTLTAEVESDVPQYVATDPVRLRQVLVNLMSNALKFTERGWVQVSARSLVCPGGRPCVSFSVQDSGIGIPDELLPSIFEPFAQADTSTTRRYGGTGLGLSICRHLAELLSGRLEAHSTVGVGSTFRLLIPLQEAEASPGSAPATVGPEAATNALNVAGDGNAPRVLVAEDHLTNRWMLSRQLEKLGMAADLHEDGAEALKAFKAGSYDLVITDYLMPRLDGIQLTRAIRELDAARGERTPILGLTANAFQDAIERCSEAGMDMVLTKPTTQDSIRDAIITLLGLAPLDPSPLPEDESGAWARPLVLFDDGPVQELFHDDPAAGRAWLEDAINTIRARYVTLVDGGGDVAAVSAAVHALRGVAGTVGARALGEECADIQSDLNRGVILDPRKEVDRVAVLVADTLAAMQAFLHDWPSDTEHT